MTDPVPVPAEHALAGIAVEALVTSDLRPFCRVVVRLADGSVAVGQLTPGEVIGLGTDWIAAAQAARDDAGILSALVDLLGELGSEPAAAKVTAVAVLDEVRRARQANVLAGEGIDAPAPAENPLDRVQRRAGETVEKIRHDREAEG